MTKKNLQLAGYETNPLEDDSLSNYKVHSVPITKSTLEVLKDLNLSMKVATKCKNFFALGIMLWLYNRSIERTINWITRKFKNDQIIAEANIRVLKAGYNFGETAEIFTTRYEIKPAKLRKGIYRNINGNDALSLGLIAGSVKSGLDIFLGSYPITPASDILHFMSRQKKIWCNNISGGR